MSIVLVALGMLLIGLIAARVGSVFGKRESLGRELR